MRRVCDVVGRFHRHRGYICCKVAHLALEKGYRSWKMYQSLPKNKFLRHTDKTKIEHDVTASKLPHSITQYSCYIKRCEVETRRSIIIIKLEDNKWPGMQRAANVCFPPRNKLT